MNNPSAESEGTCNSSNTILHLLEEEVAYVRKNLVKGCGSQL